ncbi:MAG: hypothetical protein JEZ07_05380 [Phycisphaerae bacterium]|nr:hypothetical protein [Phycisphaerae bacterium]
MKKIAVLCLALVFATSLVFASGCCSKCKRNAGTCPAGQQSLCTGCGQVKGSPQCCDPTAEKCTKCDKAKGSPGCCK